MRFDARQIAGLCNGSTPDSDSVCEGSNPSPAAKNRLSIGQPVFLRFSMVFVFFRLSKNCQAKSYGGKKSVKGNRQGFLSRQITRRSGRIAKSCYKILFAIRKAACQRSPKGPWQARSARPDHRLPTANSKFFRTSSRRHPRRDFFHLPHCILLKITGYFL